MENRIRIINRIDGEQEILEHFLYLAVFVPQDAPHPPPTIIQEPELYRYIENWGKPDDHVVYALMDEKVVGACWTRCFPQDQPGYGTVTPTIPELSIAVLPDYRGKGIGSKLLTTLMDEIKPIYPAVSLSVSSANPAKALYERFGFKTVLQTPESYIMIMGFTQSSYLSDSTNTATRAPID